TELDSAMGSLFQSILPAGLLTPAEKLSAIIRGSEGDPDREKSLQLLGRLHPGVAMALGMAHAEPIGAGLTTFEIRAWDAAKSQDLAVVGRVTVEAGHPITLPAPDRPVPVPEVDDKARAKPESVKGDLNVKLRWSTSADLRRLSILNYGFNVYRITKSFAQANLFDVTPPTPLQLLTLAAGNPNVHRVNQAPVMKTRDFDPGTGAGQVADFSSSSSDRTTYFVADDNDRFLPGGAPFVDGSEYYYFVTARDILGRDGLVSAGAPVLLCRRMPPLSPKGLRVLNDYALELFGPRQSLQLVWPQNASTPGDPTTEYWVYRWTSVSNMVANEADPTINRIAMVPHVNGLNSRTNLDYGLIGSPTVAANAGETFWYSVRAVAKGACTNVSGNSAPAYGVLRDREGPGAPTGFIEFDCIKPTVRFVGTASEQPNAPLDGNRFYFRVECLRSSPAIAWAEFYAQLNGGSNYLGRQAFVVGEPSVAISVNYPRPGSDSAAFFCRVGLADGQVSDYAMSGTVPPPTTGIRVVLFAGDVIVTSAHVGNVAGVPNDPCNRHTPLPPSGGGSVKGPCVNVNLHPKTRAWKVYRRLDDGPLTLLKAGTNDATLTVNFCDDTPPPNFANGCYYVQAFDANNNASPMALLGCIELEGTTPLPIPVLGAIGQGGSDSNPTMTLTWFCPPHGVDRFEVGIASKAAETSVPLPANVSPLLSTTPTVTKTILVVKGATNSYDLDFRRTPQPGPLFGTAGAQFSVNVAIDKNLEYTVLVHALSPGKDVGTNSNIQQFKWRPARVDQPQVPWPARDLPPVTTGFNPDIQAVQLSSVFDGLAVRIGRVPVDPASELPLTYPLRVPGTPADPLSWVFTNSISGERVLPIALYRYQVPNANYPNVSGDVTQVSPLMERIAFAIEGGRTAVYDPFIRLWREPNVQSYFDMYLIDTQPVVVGARYKYLLARFKPNHEIDQVIGTNEVEVQP
ncbi:MAG TPA: hypothetical protein VNH84_21520, partial [Candidatus Saccharimonadales bacterium]|nr:hypothetical protein [Candidatus Saccharimonadales bacterium]